MRFFPLYATLGVVIIILLNHFGILPMPLWLSGIFFVAFVALATRWPREMFGAFLATIPLELVPMVTVGSTELRWYQMLAVALAVGIVGKKALSICHSDRTLGKVEGGVEESPEISRLHPVVCKQQNYARNDKGWTCPLWRISPVDWVIVSIVFFGFISAMLNGGGAIKQTVVLLSFVFLYFLTRFFVRTRGDIREFLPYLIGSFFVVALYGILQNILFANGFTHQEVMPGRPNATFSEADWFGLYAALGVVLSAVLIFSSHHPSIPSSSKEGKKRGVVLQVIAFGLFCVAVIALILSVARSAWLAALVGLGVMTLGIWMKYGFRRAREWGWRVVAMGIIAIIFVFGLRLTTFELGNRAQSVGTGLQEITVACQRESHALPETIASLEELSGYGCKHINLEEKEVYRQQGLVVTTVSRKDPNVEIRKRIWNTSLSEIERHPVFGVGWGNIGYILGMDDRGASLSSSNIFLEFWLGSGVVGLIGIVFVFGWLMRENIKHQIENVPSQSKIQDPDSLSVHYSSPITHLYSLSFLAIISALLVFNLFNSAHFLAIVWVAFAFFGIREHINKSLH